LAQAQRALGELRDLRVQWNRATLAANLAAFGACLNDPPLLQASAGLDRRNRGRCPCALAEMAARAAASSSPVVTSGAAP